MRDHICFFLISYCTYSAVTVPVYSGHGLSVLSELTKWFLFEFTNLPYTLSRPWSFLSYTNILFAQNVLIPTFTHIGVQEYGEKN